LRQVAGKKLNFLKARRQQLGLQLRYAELAHFQIRAAAAVEDQILANLEAAVAAPVDQYRRSSQGYDAVLMQIGKMLAHPVARIAVYGEPKKSVWLEQETPFFERALDGWRDMFEHVRREDEIVHAGHPRVALREVKPGFAVIVGIGVIEFVREDIRIAFFIRHPQTPN